MDSFASGYSHKAFLKFTYLVVCVVAPFLPAAELYSTMGR